MTASLYAFDPADPVSVAGMLVSARNSLREAPGPVAAAAYDVVVAALADLASLGDIVIEWEDEEDEPDLSSCPWFQRTGTCSFGCQEEPACETCIPSDGWPVQRPVVFS